MCFLGTAKPKPKSKPKQQPKPRIYCPFQSQHQNRAINPPHFVTYHPPPPSPSPPSYGWTRPKPKPKAKKSTQPSQEMASWEPTDAYEYPPSYPPPFDPAKSNTYPEFNLYEQQKELEKYRTADKAAKEEREKQERAAKDARDQSLRDQLQQVQFEQGKELDMFKERQWHRDDQFQSLMLHTLSNKLNPPPPPSAKVGSEHEQPWEKDIGALRREFEEQRRATEMKEAIARAKAETRKEFEAEGVRKVAEERSRHDNGWQREGRDHDFRNCEDDRMERRGRRPMDERFEDFGRGFGYGLGSGRREAARSPPPPRFLPPPLRRSEGYSGYGYRYDQGPRPLEDPYIDYGMPWNRPPQPRTREPIRSSFLDEKAFNDRLKGIESSQQRVESRFQVEDQRRVWEKEWDQRDMMRNLNSTLGHISSRIGY